MTITIPNPINAVKSAKIKKVAIDMIRAELQIIRRNRGKARVRLYESRGNDENAAQALRDSIAMIKLGEETIDRLKVA